MSHNQMYIIDYVEYLDSLLKAIEENVLEGAS